MVVSRILDLFDQGRQEHKDVLTNLVAEQPSSPDWMNQGFGLAVRNFVAGAVAASMGSLLQFVLAILIWLGFSLLSAAAGAMTLSHVCSRP